MSDWAVNGGGAISMGIATAMTVIAAQAAANSVIRLRGFSVATDSVTASDSPMLVEIIRAAAMGTATSVTPVNKNPAHTAASGFTAKKTHTVEPGTPTVVREFRVPVQGESDFSFSELEQYLSPAGGMIGLRVTCPQAQNLRVALDIAD